MNPSASVCKDFAVLGYCGKGRSCTERHVHECPNYTNTGTCHNKKCRLPHVDRAGQIRKRDANTSGTSIQNGAVHSVEEENDVTSEEEDYDEIDSDDVNSDGLGEEDLMDVSDDIEAHALSQQKDFVGLSS